MAVRLRLGQNWYKYNDTDTIDRDLKAAVLRLKQFEKQGDMLRRNVETLRRGRDEVAAQLAEAQAKHRAGARARKAEESHAVAEDGDDGV